MTDPLADLGALLLVVSGAHVSGDGLADALVHGVALGVRGATVVPDHGALWQRQSGALVLPGEAALLLGLDGALAAVGRGALVLVLRRALLVIHGLALLLPDLVVDGAAPGRGRQISVGVAAPVAAAPAVLGDLNLLPAAEQVGRADRQEGGGQE